MNGGNRGFTPLLTAIDKGNVDEVRTLLDSGADVNATDAGGYTPLMAAASVKNEEVVKLLLEKGANVGKKNKDGCTALVHACISGTTKIVDMLLTKGADVDESCNNGATPLLAAIDAHNVDIVKALLENPYMPADVNKAGVGGITPLNRASFKNNDVVVDMLLAKGADATIKDDFGYDALETATAQTGVFNSYLTANARIVNALKTATSKSGPPLNKSATRKRRKARR